MSEDFKVYRYRWVVLGTFMFITAMVQVQWLTHASIARAAEVFYAGQFDPESLINIDFISMVYMLVFLVMCIPASYIIDTYGIKIGLGIGAVLVAVFSLMKGFFAADFTMVVIAQLGLAVAQPFILNAVTALSVRWFPLRERGLCAGLSALAQYGGIIVAMGVIPLMVVTTPGTTDYGAGIDNMLFIFGVISALSAVAVLIFIKDTPPSPPSFETYEHTRFFEGFRYIFGRRDMIITMILFLVGLGMFNAISTMVDSIAENLGVTDSDGLIGVCMIGGGVIGAVLLPTLSDKFRKRKLFLLICVFGMLPGIAGLTFADILSNNADKVYIIALSASGILGFFVMSAGPIGFQYAAEVSYPAPESSSQGMLLLSGQITGLIFVAGMSSGNNIYLDLFMKIFFFLIILVVILSLFLKESPMIITEHDKLSVRE